MKIFLLIICSVIQCYCFAQNCKIKKQNNYYRYKKYDTQFVLTTDSIILYYKYYASHFKTQENEASDIERELQIVIPVSTIRLNRRQPIPDSAINIKGTYFVYANWYEGYILYDSYRGFLKLREIKKDSVKVNVYLIGKIGESAYILMNNKNLMFRKKQ